MYSAAILFSFYSVSVFLLQRIVAQKNAFRLDNTSNFWKRTTYEDVPFGDYNFYDLLNEERTLDEYKVFINKGLDRYLQVLRAIRESKKTADLSPPQDKFNGSTFKSDQFENVTLDQVSGLSNVNVMMPHVFDGLGNRFEINSTFFYPEVIFTGFIHDEDGSENPKGKSFEYKLFNVSFIRVELKKLLEEEVRIKLIQTTERIQFDAVQLFVSGKPQLRNTPLGKFIESVVTKRLSELIEHISNSTKSYWKSTDVWYLNTVRERLVQKLASIATTAVSTLTVQYDLPRFSFQDKKSSIYYDLVSGSFELNTADQNAKISAKSDLEDDALEVSFPVQGWLKFYALQQNCTESCYFTGHRFRVTGANARIRFTEAVIQDILWLFKMEYSESLVDGRGKPPTQNFFDAVLDNVSAKINEKFTNFAKSFVGKDKFH